MSYFELTNTGAGSSFTSGGASFESSSLPAFNRQADFIIVNDSDSAVRVIITRAYTDGDDFRHDVIIDKKSYDFFNMPAPAGATAAATAAPVSIQTAHGTSAHDDERVYLFRAGAITT